MNRILIFLSIILLFVLLGGGVYYFVLRDGGEQPPQDNPVFTPGGDPVTIPGDGEDDDFIIDPQPSERNILTQIYDGSTAGAQTFTQEVEVTSGSTTETIRSQEVRFVDKQTGHIYAYDPEADSAERLSNTTFPGIQETHWFTDPNRVVLRYLGVNNEIESFIGVLQEGRLEGSYLDINIPVLTTSNDSILQILETSSGVEGVLSDEEGRDTDSLFTSDLTATLIAGFTDASADILTKPVSSLPGSLYRYEGSSIERIVGGKNGLTALPSPSGTNIVYSESTDRSFRAAVINTETGEERPLPIQLLPEKCTWASDAVLYCMVPEVIPPANYPEHWYQGFISFSDALWRINVEDGVARALAFFDESGPFDGTYLSVDEDEEYLTFINRRDESLWGFDL